MEYQNCLHGVFPVVPTPLSADESVDHQGFSYLIDYYIDSGSHGLLVLGSGGEFPYLTYGEKIDLVKTACDTVQKKVPLIVGVGFFSLAETINFIKEINPLPIDGVLVILPTYFKIGFDDILLSYSKIAEISGKPILMYNYPQQTEAFLTPRQISQILDIKGVIGMKDSILGIGEIKKHIRPNKSIFSGNSFCIRKILDIGGSGVMGLLPSIVPAMVVDCYEAYRNNQPADGNRLQQRILNLLPLINSFSPSAGIQKTLVRMISSLPIQLKSRNPSRTAVVKETLVQLGHPITAVVKSPQPQIGVFEQLAVKEIISNNQITL